MKNRLENSANCQQEVKSAPLKCKDMVSAYLQLFEQATPLNEASTDLSVKQHENLKLLQCLQADLDAIVHDSGLTIVDIGQLAKLLAVYRDRFIVKDGHKAFDVNEAQLKSQFFDLIHLIFKQLTLLCELKFTTHSKADLQYQLIAISDSLKCCGDLSQFLSNHLFQENLGIFSAEHLEYLLNKMNSLLIDFDKLKAYQIKRKALGSQLDLILGALTGTCQFVKNTLAKNDTITDQSIVCINSFLHRLTFSRTITASAIKTTCSVLSEWVTASELPPDAINGVNIISLLITANKLCSFEEFSYVLISVGKLASSNRLKKLIYNDQFDNVDIIANDINNFIASLIDRHLEVDPIIVTKILEALSDLIGYVSKTITDQINTTALDNLLEIYTPRNKSQIDNEQTTINTNINLQNEKVSVSSENTVLDAVYPTTTIEQNEDEDGYPEDDDNKANNNDLHESLTAQYLLVESFFNEQEQAYVENKDNPPDDLPLDNKIENRTEDSIDKEQVAEQLPPIINNASIPEDELNPIPCEDFINSIQFTYKDVMDHWSASEDIFFISDDNMLGEPVLNKSELVNQHLNQNRFSESISYANIHSPHVLVVASHDCPTIQNNNDVAIKNKVIDQGGCKDADSEHQENMDSDFEQVNLEQEADNAPRIEQQENIEQEADNAPHQQDSSESNFGQENSEQEEYNAPDIEKHENSDSDNVVSEEGYPQKVKQKKSKKELDTNKNIKQVNMINRRNIKVITNKESGNDPLVLLEPDKVDAKLRRKIINEQGNQADLIKDSINIVNIKAKGTPDIYFLLQYPNIVLTHNTTKQIESNKRKVSSSNQKVIRLIRGNKNPYFHVDALKEIDTGGKRLKLAKFLIDRNISVYSYAYVNKVGSNKNSRAYFNFVLKGTDGIILQGKEAENELSHLEERVKAGDHLNDIIIEVLTGKQISNYKTKFLKNHEEKQKEWETIVDLNDVNTQDIDAECDSSGEINKLNENISALDNIIDRREYTANKKSIKKSFKIKDNVSQKIPHSNIESDSDNTETRHHNKVKKVSKKRKRNIEIETADDYPKVQSGEDRRGISGLGGKQPRRHVITYGTNCNIINFPDFMSENKTVQQNNNSESLEDSYEATASHAEDSSMINEINEKTLREFYGNVTPVNESIALDATLEKNNKMEPELSLVVVDTNIENLAEKIVELREKTRIEEAAEIETMPRHKQTENSVEIEDERNDVHNNALLRAEPSFDISNYIRNTFEEIAKTNRLDKLRELFNNLYNKLKSEKENCLMNHIGLLVELLNGYVYRNIKNETLKNNLKKDFGVIIGLVCELLNEGRFSFTEDAAPIKVKNIADFIFNFGYLYRFSYNTTLPLNFIEEQLKEMSDCVNSSEQPEVDLSRTFSGLSELAVHAKSKKLTLVCLSHFEKIAKLPNLLFPSIMTTINALYNLKNAIVIPIKLISCHHITNLFEKVITFREANASDIIKIIYRVSHLDKLKLLNGEINTSTINLLLNQLSRCFLTSNDICTLIKSLGSLSLTDQNTLDRSVDTILAKLASYKFKEREINEVKVGLNRLIERKKISESLISDKNKYKFGIKVQKEPIPNRFGLFSSQVTNVTHVASKDLRDDLRQGQAYDHSYNNFRQEVEHTSSYDHYKPRDNDNRHNHYDRDYVRSQLKSHDYYEPSHGSHVLRDHYKSGDHYSHRDRPRDKEPSHHKSRDYHRYESPKSKNSY